MRTRTAIWWARPRRPGVPSPRSAPGRSTPAGCRPTGPSYAGATTAIYGQATPPGGAFASVSAGGNHTCGVLYAGAMTGHAVVPCWGYYHTCGVETGGPSYAGVGRVWPGHAARGFLRLGQLRVEATPAGCRPTGPLECWGSNEDDDGNFDRPGHAARRYLRLGQRRRRFHTCGVLTNGAVVCWGSNDFGDGNFEGPGHAARGCLRLGQRRASTIPAGCRPTGPLPAGAAWTTMARPRRLNRRALQSPGRRSVSPVLALRRARGIDGNRGEAKQEGGKQLAFTPGVRGILGESVGPRVWVGLVCLLSAALLSACFRSPRCKRFGLSYRCTHVS